jgi:hypothetical protein
MFKTVLRQLLVLTLDSLAISSVVPLYAQSRDHLGDERDLDAQVTIPRSWGSLRDLPSPTSSYCTDYSGPKGIWVEIMADFSWSLDSRSANGGLS